MRRFRRAAASSYTKNARRRSRAKPKPIEAGTIVTQEERVEWARSRLRSAIGRSTQARHADPVLRAAVLARRQELERELLALERITGVSIPTPRKR